MTSRILQRTGWALALMCLPACAWALGVGNIEVRSGLNEPLLAEFPLLTRNPAELEQAEARLADADDYRRVDLEFTPILSQLRFEVVRRADGRAVVQVTTEKPVREPFVTFLVEVNWERGRLLREYSILLDPPAMLVTPDPGRVEVRPATAPAPPPATVSDTTAPVEEPVSQPADTAPTVAAPAEAEPAPTVATPAEAEPAPVEAQPEPVPARPTVPAGDVGPVRRGDTLWRIAQSVRPDGISMNEMMVAILRANPDAFFLDNVNALKEGAILRIPDRDEIRNVGERVALEAVRTHNQAWQDYRSRLAASAPTVVESRVGDTPASRTPAPVSRPTSRVEVVPALADGGGVTAAAPGEGTDNAERLRQALALTQEELLNEQQQGDELQSRVTDLESQVGKLERLLELKDAELAAFQSQLQDVEADTGMGVDEAAAPGPETGAVAGGPEAPASGAEPVAAPGETGAETASVAEPAAATSPAPAVMPPPARRATTWYSNPLYLAGGGAALLLIAIVAWVFLGRGRESTEGGLFAGKAEPALAGAGGGSLAERLMSAPARDETDKPDEEDELSETGSGMEVEELTDALESMEDESVLLAAMEQNPEDPEPRIELLEFYFSTGERDKFQDEAEKLLARLGDPLDSRWLKVAELGRQVAPENPLFGGPGEAQDVDTTSDKDLEFLEFDLEEELQEVGVGTEEPDRRESAPETAAAAPPEEQPAGAPEPASAETETPAEPEPEPEPEQAGEGEELLAGGIGAGLAETEGPAPGADDAEEDLTRDLAAEIEKELGLELEARGEGEARESEDKGDPLEGLSLSLEERQAGGSREEPELRSEEPDTVRPKPARRDDEEAAEEEPAAPTASEAPEPEKPEELPDLEFELDEDALASLKSSQAPEQKPAAQPGLESAESPEEPAQQAPERTARAPAAEPEPETADEDEEELDVEESVATKLDLARAYMDMGDPESARNMVEEVLSEGNEQQKAEAEALLSRI